MIIPRCRGLRRYPVTTQTLAEEQITMIIPRCRGLRQEPAKYRPYEGLAP